MNIWLSYVNVRLSYVGLGKGEGIYQRLKAFTSSTALNGARQGAGSVTYTEELHRDDTNLYPSMRKVCQVQVVAREWGENRQGMKDRVEQQR